MTDFDRLLSMALDLTRSLAVEDRHRRLVDTVAALIPCDAACLLRREGDAFVPLATRGLTKDTAGRRFAVGEHPRLDILAAASEPVRFPPDSSLPDPFDGLLEADHTALGHVHACLGWPLRVEGQLVGLLTADALAPDAFDELEPEVLSWLGALAGAAVQTSHLIESLQRSSERMGLIAEDLMRSSSELRGRELLGTSPAMEALRREVDLVARAGLPVLVTGETGTGKELVAHALHRGSSRSDRPLIYVNCAALPASVAESELFGHVRGAFTGAERHRTGKLELADGATLFLDEIGELPLELQPKLLRALQQGEIQRVGSDETLHVDVRILAATNRDLDAEIAAGRFREDLYHRLNVYRVHVPPLRERRGDIELLAGHFCDLARLRLGLGPVRLDAGARDRLVSHDWRGNVRELENTVQRGVLRASEGVGRGGRVVVTEDHLGEVRPPVAEKAARPHEPPAPLADRPMNDLVDDFRRDVIRRTVEREDGNWAAAARSLGMHRSNLHHLAKRLGLR
ncbi:MAG: nitric oxide reductase transcriptional regulator NorR [Polyangiaceae bacterium]